MTFWERVVEWFFKISTIVLKSIAEHKENEKKLQNSIENKLIDPDRNKYGLKLIKEDNRRKHRQAIRNKIEPKDSDAYSPSEGKKKQL